MMCVLLREAGLGPCSASLTVDQLGTIAADKTSCPYLIVNTDAFEDCEAAVEAMLSFRSRRGDLVLLLVSSTVAGDDLAAERRMICDATLRAPVTLTRLRRGLAAAFSNHEERAREG